MEHSLAQIYEVAVRPATAVVRGDGRHEHEVKYKYFQSLSSDTCKSIKPNEPIELMDGRNKSVAVKSIEASALRSEKGNECKTTGPWNPETETCVVHVTGDGREPTDNHRDAGQTGVGWKILQTIWGFFSPHGC